MVSRDLGSVFRARCGFEYDWEAGRVIRGSGEAGEGGHVSDADELGGCFVLTKGVFFVAEDLVVC